MANFNITVAEYQNEQPIVGDGSRSTDYGVDIVLNRVDFTSNTAPPYFDPEGDLPLLLKILTLPTDGILKLNGVPVSVNQELSFIDDIDTENFTYAPDLAIKTIQSLDFEFAIADAGSGLFTS